jgi:hypothetical protein
MGVINSTVDHADSPSVNSGAADQSLEETREARGHFAAKVVVRLTSTFSLATHFFIQI